MRWLASVALVPALLSCSGASLELFVDLRTDLLGNQEFDHVRVVLEPGAVRDAPAIDESYLGGVRVAEITDLSPGDHVLIVTLLRGSTPLVERVLRVNLRESVAITVLISRECRSLICDTDESCRAGECVPLSCSELSPDECPEPACVSDDECTAASACATSRCVEGDCLASPDSSLCEVGERCNPDEGCVALPGVPQVVDGVEYEVREGYSLDAPLALNDETRALIAGRANAIAFPSAASTFPPGLYLGAGGDAGTSTPPTIFRFQDGVAVEYAVSNGIDGPDERFSQMQFTDPDSAWGDRLFASSASGDAGDGIYYVDAAGTFGLFASLNNCYGLVFDHDGLLGNPGFDAPLYVNFESATTLRYSPDGTNVALTMSLPIYDSGYRMHLSTAGRFAGQLWLVSGGYEPRNDGALTRVDAVEPWSHTELYGGLDDPGGAAFTNGGPLGDYLVLTVPHLGELRGHELDGTFVRLVSGLSEPVSAAVHDGAIYFVENGRGQVLRLEPTNP